METITKQYKEVKNLLSKGGNAKINKNEVTTYNLSLAPYKQNAKGTNICPKASKGCALACLFTAGRGKFTNVQQARINKTNYYLFDRQKFINQLAKEINKIAIKSKLTNEIFALRLNTLSDVDFVYQLKKYADLDLLNDDTYKNIIVYDYTAIPGKVKKYLDTRYHVTLSRKEDNEQDVMNVLNAGGNVSIVFRNELPDTYKGFKVVDGDKTDLEMTKYKNVVLGLKAKGDAKKDTTGFVVD
ncbi:MAG: hypothetical protein GOVbin3107_48 [Prokaryotic dsDNA virus sp.]|nr:MAG: hypothetical protein GOVbin3107_48 [Prokaryotic dsDNA virus sp.]|tara:strand:+ start:685 stop:1410 length:726 start_codon:yes stop_codon:yes gene_type:complete